MKTILIYSVFLFSSLQLYAASQAPVDVRGQNLVGTRHSGYGEYSDVDDYEGINLLKKNCVETNPPNLQTDAGDRADCQPSFFSIFKKKKEVATSGVDEVVATIEDDYTQTFLSNYTGRILSSELKKSCGETIDPVTCPAKVFPDNQMNTLLLESSISKANQLPSREDIRSNAMTLQNAISAAMLAKRCARSSNVGAQAYFDRLKLNYPYLFKSSPQNQGYDSLLDALTREGLTVPTEDMNEGDVRLHSNALKTIMATLDRNPTMKQTMQDKLAAVLQDYGQNLKRDINPASKICSITPKDLMSRYPQIVNQALIDLPLDQRKTVSSSLCKIKAFYDPDKYDTDCDGLVDSRDGSPQDPFRPNTDTHLNFTSSENPPFGSSIDYRLIKENNRISILLDVNLNPDAGLPPEKKAAFFSKMRSCLGTDLVNEFKTNFEVLKQAKPQAFSSQDVLNVEFNIQENSSSDAVAIHNCFCSTCKLTYNYNGQEKTVPRHYCLNEIKNAIIPSGESLSQDEMNTIKSAFLAQSRNGLSPGNVWWEQEDALNLTPNTDCGTMKHETIHRLGLPDEYVSGYYPFSRIGVSNSIMNNQNKSVLPRHLARILSPNNSAKYCSL